MKESLIVLGICFITTASCEKRLFDYRNKYCGDFYFEVEETMTVNSETTVENYQYNGSVFYTKENERDEIRINYREGYTGTLLISKEGILSEEASLFSSLSGEFFGKDSVYCLNVYTQSPAASGSTEIRGVRID